VLTERRRVLRLLRDRSLAPVWLGRFAEQAGEWTFAVSLLVMAWSRTGNVMLASWVLAAFFIPRLVVAGFLDSWMRKLPLRSLPLVTSLQASIALIVGVLTLALNVRLDEILLGSAAAMGFLTAVSNETRGNMLRGAVPLSRLGAAVLTDALVDRAGLLVGALAGAMLVALTAPAGLVASAVVLGAAAVLGRAMTRRSAAISVVDRPPVTIEAADQRVLARRTAVYLVAAFATGALGAVLVIATLPLGATSSGLLAATVGLLLASAALGMLVGPLPVARMLLRVPAPVLLFATVVVTAGAAVLVTATQSAAVAVGAFLVFGVAAATQDALRAIAIRRLVPHDLFDRVTRLSRLALTVGQIYGALGVISFATPDPFAILGVLAVSQVMLVGVGIALGGRDSLRVGGLSSLPIKSVVHELSWATRTPAIAADFAAHESRVRRLAAWINRQVEMERLEVVLPISKRAYDIYRPDEASRERLFEQGRADPDKQMPYWAKVWPSGVALADVVVERKLEVSDKHVLELGAGLGVTAAAVLEYGGHIVTADYSALPLAHCRLNSLVNTGRSPRAACFNWRHDDEVTAATGQAEFREGFPLIIAGDVLYEGRDAEPLLNVIERLLVADGSVWLAEPVRRTAQRFLDSAATLGWEIESRQVKADWPDATSGPVNLHFLTRSPEPDRIIADLGGWRI